SEAQRCSPHSDEARSMALASPPDPDMDGAAPHRKAAPPRRKLRPPLVGSGRAPTPSADPAVRRYPQRRPLNPRGPTSARGADPVASPVLVRGTGSSAARVADVPDVVAGFGSLCIDGRYDVVSPCRGVVRQVSILHLPGVVEYVVRRVAEQVRDRPVAQRPAFRVPRAHPIDESVAGLSRPLRRQQAFQLGLRLHTLREVAPFVLQDVANDLVAGAAAAADTRPELCRSAGGHLVELGPRGAEQPHLTV